MTDFLATINGHRLTALHVHVPFLGVWYADADVAEEVSLQGKVEINLGKLTLRGTVLPGFSGSFGMASKVRIIAGAGGWQSLIPPKNYHSDAGVKTSTILTDVARIVGETLGTITPSRERVGADYVRSAGPASRVLDQLVSNQWWVDFQGATHVGKRQTSPASGYELLEFDARSKVATLSVDDASVIQIGSIITGANLPEPVQIRELEIVLDADKLRIKAWCGGDSGSSNRITDALLAVTRAENSKKLHGLWRYRVYAMAGDRFECQAVSKHAGLPDILPISMMPGMPGSWADLRPGSTVIVQFVEGDPTLPIVTHYAQKGTDGYVPMSLEIDADSIKIAMGTMGVARVGDSVQAGPYTGTITSGSTKVTCG